MNLHDDVPAQRGTQSRKSYRRGAARFPPAADVSQGPPGLGSRSHVVMPSAGGVGQLVSQARSIESKCSLFTGLAM